MLPKENRLSRKDIESLKSQRKPVFQGKFFGLVFSMSNDNKFALILPKKLVSRAVDRNFLRRKFFIAISEITNKKNGHYLFLAKKGLEKSSSEEIKIDLETLINKI